MNPFKVKLLKRALAFAAIFIVVFMTAGKTLLGVRRMNLDTTSSWGPMVVGAAAIGAIYLLMDQSTFLPFLGDAFIPPSVLNVGTGPKDATMNVTVGHAPEGATHAVYWAASPSSSVVSNPQDAYSDFSNAGVVKVQSGQATFALVCPAAYNVPRRSSPLDRHVHYRWVFPNGLMSPVKTENVMCA